MPVDGSDASSRDEIRSLRDLSPQQWKSGIAAWLGWLFDGLDMHLYVLVAAPFVAELIGVTDTRNEVVASRTPRVPVVARKTRLPTLEPQERTLDVPGALPPRIHLLPTTTSALRAANAR